MVSVFKTSVKSKKAVKEISPALNQLVKSSYWNFDLQDCDNILRVESNEYIADRVIQILSTNGFECFEL